MFPVPRSRHFSGRTGMASLGQWSINNHSSIYSPHHQHKTEEEKKTTFRGVCFYSLLRTDQENRISLNGFRLPWQLVVFTGIEYKSNERIKLLLLWKETQSSEGAIRSPLTWRRGSLGLLEPWEYTNLSIF